MSVTAKELWAAANKSLHHSDCEADHRGVMSRSYYSIYQDGVEFHNGLASPGTLTVGSRGGKHENLHQQLKSPTINKTSASGKRSRQLGHLMATLHASRVKADYSRDAAIAATDAADCVAHAKTVLDLLFPPIQSLGPIVPSLEKPIVPPSSKKANRPTLKRIK